MNRNEFTNQYHSLGNDFNFDNHLDEVKHVVHESYYHDGDIMKLMIAQEECAELIVAINKYRRCQSDTCMDILEELADVSIMIEYVLITLGFTDEDLQKAVFVKIQREKRRLEELLK